MKTNSFSRSAALSNTYIFPSHLAKWSPVKKTFFALAVTLGGGYLLYQSEGIKPLVDKTIALLNPQPNKVSPPILPVVSPPLSTALSTYFAVTSDSFLNRYCEVTYDGNDMPSFKGPCSKTLQELIRNECLEKKEKKIREEIENQIEKEKKEQEEIDRKWKDPTIEEYFINSRNSCAKNKEKYLRRLKFDPCEMRESELTAMCPNSPIKLHNCQNIPLEKLVKQEGVTPTCLEHAECILGINLHTNTTKGRPPTLSETIPLVEEARKKLFIFYHPDKNQNQVELATDIYQAVNTAADTIFDFIKVLQKPMSTYFNAEKI